MSQSDSRGLVLGALAGAAGLTLAVVWYQSRRAGAGRMVAQELYLNSNDHHVGASVSVAWAGQREVLDRLGALIQCVSELKEEVRALKAALPLLQDHVRDELQGGSRRAAESRRATPTRKRRTAGPSARQDGQSSEDAGSEGGYMTAMTDSEEEDKKGREAKEEEEEEEEDENQEEPDELSILLESADALHAKETERGVGLAPLLERRGQFEQDYAFMWRLARAYSDAHDMAQDREEKKSMAESGKKAGEEAIALNPDCADSHQWFAILCGQLSEYDSIQNKIKNGYLFKDHLDRAIELKPEDPLSYYLLGRWCYAVAQCTWIERKIAATLFGEPPNATVQDALKNFLKAEEICPKYSKANLVFLAKCYKELGQKQQAREVCNTASCMDNTTKEVGQCISSSDKTTLL
ncbi:regulator of microtubule dynamics protein 2 isoform X2 [Clupea harengus]|nr:regulator of microtubule dynamics protein 2 isoform X2 [Clupea harengus]XP_031434536.1 regulator of microtubule dynamics protein 2 isoform X2 [Clupea harengus]XP_031434537.1 regulator of microtubule dynamics protein 2 isoform X2 [Clupea harengus]XP_031434538.1 regulator of microtubule dynamics protein 2 isoform X2 [Clupea harengus]XP_031434539.1 regulator of microtubule dynamics protein 2 isoform X2 [Clupea harengus]XP_031434540.1 regulator of microtubule dynamics protein 2 isoform X2 [Clup